MANSPFSPFRNDFVRNLKDMPNSDLLALFYTNLRWINYFQDEDDLFTFLKIVHDVNMEVRNRRLKFNWSNKNIKKYRIMGQKMYYGSLSFKELEWRLGFIIMYAIPVHRNFVTDKMYLVRERVRIIIEAIHELNRWSELEYNKDVIWAMDAPFFSYDNFSDIWQVLKLLLLASENFVIFVLFVAHTLLGVIPLIWKIFDPDYVGLKLIFMVAVTFLFACLVCDIVEEARN